MLAGSREPNQVLLSSLFRLQLINETISAKFVTEIIFFVCHQHFIAIVNVLG